MRKELKKLKNNFKIYLEEGLIKKEPFKKEIFGTYLRNYKESIRLLHFIDKHKISFLWEIVVAYYSMFYLANAFLYKLGYKLGHRIVHKVTADALIVLARDKLKKTLIDAYETSRKEALELASIKADEIISSFDRERIKRNIFQYSTHEEIKEAKAKTSFKRAIEFCNALLKLLDE